MLYRLSKIIPVRMRSTYRVLPESPRDGFGDRYRSTWWQWRGRVLRHHMVEV